MTVKAAESAQTKREYCIAVMNRLCHSNSICPGNHDVDYNRGWFYFDDMSPEQRPELTAEADEEMDDPAKCIGYSPVWNTYVLIDDPDYVNDEDDW